MCGKHDNRRILEKCRGGITLTPGGHRSHAQGAEHSQQGGTAVTRGGHSTHIGRHNTHGKRGIADTQRGHRTHTRPGINQPERPSFKGSRRMPAAG